MADDGTGDDLWANTKPSDSGANGGTDASPPTEPAPTTPQPTTPEPSPSDPTTVQPTTAQPGGGAMPPPDPGATTVQPTVGPGAAGAAGLTGAAMGGGMAGPPPGAPPEGGDGGDDGEPPNWRPPWLLPAAIALLVALVVALIAVLASRDDDDAETDSTSTTSTEVPPETDPVFIPVDSDGEPTTTEAAPTTSVPGETTIAPTTTPPATDPPATDPPATDPPATDPPATDPPATDPPATDPPTSTPDPGFASVNGEDLEIRVMCLSVPSDVGDREVVSYLVENSSGRIVIERWFDGADNGVDVDFVSSRQRASAGATGGATIEDAFAATATGDVTVELAVNPPSDGLDDCLDFVETIDGTGDAHSYSVLDLCASGADVAGITSEAGEFGAIDNGDDTASVTFRDRTIGPLNDPAALVDRDESIVAYLGTVGGGGQNLEIVIELDLATPRECTDAERP